MSQLTGIKALVGRSKTMKTKFLDSDVVIKKLTVAEVLDIQETAKDTADNETAGFDILKKVIRTATEGGADLTDEDFQSFPMDDLSKLSNEIMKFSGMGNDPQK
jgi:hypothetical protein